MMFGKDKRLLQSLIRERSEIIERLRSSEAEVASRSREIVELREECERLRKMLEDQPGDIASMLDELMNGAPGNRVEVQQWNAKR